MTEPDWQPGDRAVAPAPLDVVQAFLNCHGHQFAEEALADGPQATAWLREHALLDGDGAPVDDGDAERLRHLRERLRDFVERRGGADDTLEAALGEVRLVPRPASDGSFVLGPASPGARGAIERLAVAVLGAQSDGTWARLKICRRHACRWAFYDRSKNRSSQWCSMRVCGTRTNAKAYRDRRRAGS